MPPFRVISNRQIQSSLKKQICRFCRECFNGGMLMNVFIKNFKTIMFTWQCINCVRSILSSANTHCHLFISSSNPWKYTSFLKSAAFTPHPLNPSFHPPDHHLPPPLISPPPLFPSLPQQLYNWSTANVN